MSRISRKQMRRNEMAETVGSVVDYTRDHTRDLLWGVIAVVVLALLVGAFFFWRGQRAAGATAALAEAMAVEDDAATARERFQEVVDRYSGSAAADVARVYLGRYAATDGDAAKARELWQQAAGSLGDTALGQQAQLNLWELDRSAGRHEQAAAEIRAMLEAQERLLGADQLLYQLGLTLEAAGDQDGARDSYLRLVDEHPRSVLRGAAQQRADRLAGEAAG